MSICKYCKSKGMTKEEYNNFVNNIHATASAIKSTLIYNNGLYFKVADIFNWDTNIDLKGFIINELKKLDVEFIEDYTMYRVTN